MCSTTTHMCEKKCGEVCEGSSVHAVRCTMSLADQVKNARELFPCPGCQQKMKIRRVWKASEGTMFLLRCIRCCHIERVCSFV